jgi:hypothetical protein
MIEDPDTAISNSEQARVLCGRCSRAFPSGDPKCPYCGLKQPRPLNFSLILGSCGLVVLLILFAIMLNSLRQSDDVPQPVVSQEAAPSPAKKPALGN